jgi:tRNA(Ile2) C34 agmatinyltransferase TiaS
MYLVLMGLIPITAAGLLAAVTALLNTRPDMPACTVCGGRRWRSSGDGWRCRRCGAERGGDSPGTIARGLRAD